MGSRSLKPICFSLMAMGLAVLAVGCKKVQPITLTCNTAPPAIYPGENATASATAGSVSTKKNIDVVYSWSGDGVTGNGSTAAIATDTLNPGSYTTKVQVRKARRARRV